jgi:alanine racemase
MIFRTQIIIDFLALEHNVKNIRREGSIFAVVKANAYGHGLIKVAKKLMALGVQWLVVESISEGIKLRKSGVIEPEILLLGCDYVDDLILINKYNLTPTIYSIDSLKSLVNQITNSQKFHLEFDTGMMRTGIRLDELESVISLLKSAKLILVDGCFTHFACADVKGNEFTDMQISLFDQGIDQLATQNIHPNLVHLKNSPAILTSHEHTKFVRPGLLLYGVSPLPGTSEYKAVLSWSTKPIQIKSVEKEETVGYGRSWKASENSLIAIIPVGYADGYPRSISNKGFVLVNGIKANIIGNICMDFMFIDITNCGEVTTNTEVVLVGGDGKLSVTVNDLAAWALTIPYEILCNIGKRAQYIYLDGDEE